MKKPLCRVALLSLVLLTASWLSVPAEGGKAGVAVRGQVVDVSGAVIPGASVRLFSTERMWETKADSAGRFEFSGVPPAKYDLVVNAWYFAREVSRGLTIADKDVEGIQITLQIRQPRRRQGKDGPCVVVADCGPCVEGRPPSPYWDVQYGERSSESNLVGTVVDSASGAPVAKAKIFLSPPKEGRVAVSEKDGRFQFANVEPGEYKLFVEGYEPAEYKLSVHGYFGPWDSFWITRQNQANVRLLVSNHNECW